MNRNSEIIRLLRFPLAILVVLLHAEPSIVGWSPQNMTAEHMGANIAGAIMYSLSHILAQIAVPCFFVISGYLFFLKLERWDTREWKRKLISRFGSIVVPYIICVAVFLIKHLIIHYRIGDLDAWLNAHGGLLNMFWAAEHWKAGCYNIFGQTIFMSGPAAYHLWFLRDLIVAVLCTPMFYVLFAAKDGRIRKISLFWLAVFALFDLTRFQLSLPGVSCSTMFYFGLGAFMSLNRINLYDAFYKIRYPLAGAFVLLYFCLIPLDGSRTQSGTYIMPFFNLIGVMCVVNLAAYYTGIVSHLKIFRRYEKTSFFMFIIHPFYLAIVWRMLSAVITHICGTIDIQGIEYVDNHPIFSLILFFAKISITAILSVLTYYAVTSISPRLSKLICGR